MIELVDRQRALDAPVAALEKRLSTLHRALDIGNDEATVVLVSDRRIAELNRQFRSKSGPTDVLSFPVEAIEGIPELEEAPRELGDIFISVQRAEQQASERATQLAPAAYGLLDELTFLAIHGLLHLLGYDHHEESEAVEMEARELDLFRQFSDAPPRPHHHSPEE